jgi:hypothetical protein
MIEYPVCRRRTCLECRAESHPGTLCREGTGDDQEREEEDFGNYLDQMWWCVCDMCGRIIMLRDGCNHITYVCSIFTFV